MPTRKFNLSLSDELVKKIDQAAALEYSSRSEYIRQAVVEKLRVQAANLEVAVPLDDIELEAAYDRLRQERLRRHLRGITKS